MPAYRPPARPPIARTPPRPQQRPARAGGSAGEVDTMKVAGVLFILSAVASLAVPFIQKESFGGTAERTTSAGGAFMVLVFGAALYQGVGAVRKLVLACAAFGSLAALVAIAVFSSFRELQVLLGAVLLSCIGYLVLLLEKLASRARVIVAVGLVLAGAAGSLAAPRWLTWFTREAFAAELRPQLAPELQEYTDPASGLSVKPPAGWSFLKQDAELFAGVPAKVKLADPDAGTVVFINDERKGPGFVSLDHQLDRVLERQRQSGLEPRQHDRRDVQVGAAPARRMSMGWSYAGRSFNGFVSVWLDGPQVFTLFGAAVGSLSSATEARFKALESSMRFSAPVETALAGAERALTQRCPVFAPEAVRMIGRRIPPASPVEAYFRTGWILATRGQGQLDPVAAGELRDLMALVFARMSPSDRSRFAAYGERLRGGGATTPAEDAEAMRILGSAATALPAETLSRLQLAVETALTVGGLI